MDGATLAAIAAAVTTGLQLVAKWDASRAKKRSIDNASSIDGWARLTKAQQESLDRLDRQVAAAVEEARDARRIAHEAVAASKECERHRASDQHELLRLRGEVQALQSKAG